MLCICVLGYSCDRTRSANRYRRKSYKSVRAERVSLCVQGDLHREVVNNSIFRSENVRKVELMDR